MMIIITEIEPIVIIPPREVRYEKRSDPGAVEGMTVTKAISVAGGFTERASKSKVKIVREQDGKQVSHRAKPNELVQSQDIIEVPQSFF